MSGTRPKQYRSILGKPVLWHTLDCFERCQVVNAIITVVNPEHRAEYEQLVACSTFAKLRPAVEGGRERSDSVHAGLLATAAEDKIVLIHDAVRPVVTSNLIESVVTATLKHGAAIPALPVTETIKEVADGVVVASPDRTVLWSAQTPQGFLRDQLLAARGQWDATRPATDEAMLIERSGGTVHVVRGDIRNVKITTDADLERVSWSMRERAAAGAAEAHATSMLRVGQGYDVHRLEQGRDLILGGVTVPHQMGLAGHSDADVLTHAVIDALLGAAALGDIGRHFPDDCEEYRGISSLELLARVGRLLRERGWRPVNVDAVIMAQEPRLSPFVEAMCHNMAGALRMPAEAVSVKATTTERLGFAGRCEGIAAQSVAQIEQAPAS